ncbi:MAG: acylphosphatase [Casimicrobiaceae bacterium]
MTTTALRLLIRGRVQGVGYRDAAVQSAFVHDVAGWVRNRSDGSVEAFVQGTPEAVARYVEWCRRGPPLARVTGVEVVDAIPDPTLQHFAWRATD